MLRVQTQTRLIAADELCGSGDIKHAATLRLQKEAKARSTSLNLIFVVRGRPQRPVGDAMRVCDACACVVGASGRSRGKRVLQQQQQPCDVIAKAMPPVRRRVPCTSLLGDFTSAFPVGACDVIADVRMTTYADSVTDSSRLPLTDADHFVVQVL